MAIDGSDAEGQARIQLPHHGRIQDAAELRRFTTSKSRFPSREAVINDASTLFPTSSNANVRDKAKSNGIFRQAKGWHRAGAKPPALSVHAKVGVIYAPVDGRT